jgi:DNA-binding NtrC family response regulator
MTTQSEWSRILIVNDHPGQLETLVQLLSEEGYQVVGAATVAEALRCAECEKFSVAVVYLQLPDASGIQLVHLLKSMNGRIRVIMHSAFAGLNSAKEGVNGGASTYLERRSRRPNCLIIFVEPSKIR